MNRTINYKKESQKQWNQTPCGEVLGDKSNIEYFLSVENYRYNEYAKWMKPFFKFHQHENKKVLEIGYGQGTDLCQFALGGAICYGVDITKEHYNLAKKNFELRKLEANLYLEDASHLHFEDNTFDTVYSFGVLHHTPDTIRCFTEAYRVLKPGGEFIVSLYYRYSAYHIIKILIVDGLLKGKLKKLGYLGLLSTIEEGADGIKIKPLVKLFSIRELKILLGDFNKTSFEIKHIDKSHFSILGKFLPLFIINSFESKLGWYVIAKAQK